MALNPKMKEKALNKTHPVDMYLDGAAAAGTKQQPKRSQKNFKVDPFLCENFEIYCEYLAKSNFTDAIVRYMEDTVAANRAEITRLREALKS